MSTLANQVVQQEREDVTRGIRTLLAHPLITARARPDEFDLVRRRRQPIGRWFEHHCGWRLQVEPRAGYARLVKVRAQPDPTRPARRLRSARAPFDRRRYTLLCVLAAELLAVPVTTIGLLADRVVQATAADPMLPDFDTASRAERMAFVDALRLLEHYGVIDVVDGTSESYVDHADAKVLYCVDTTLLIRMLAAPVAPSRLDPPSENFDGWLAGLLRENHPGGSDVQRALWLRRSIVRRLVDDPVLYRDDLTPEERDYLDSPAGRQHVRQACEQAGFELEERAEGFLAVDPDGIATDGRFPDDAGNAKIAALLLLDAVVATAAGLTPEQFDAEAQQLLNRFPNWAKAYRSADGAHRLATDALAVLRAFGLAQVVRGTVKARPAAARYRAHPTLAADRDPR